MTTTPMQKVTTLRVSGNLDGVPAKVFPGSSRAAMQHPVTYIRLLARELRLDERGQRRLLTGTSLTPADIARLDQTIGDDDRLRVIRNAIALAARPGFGLEVGSRLSLAAHGPLGQLLSTSPSLAEAWLALERFHMLRVPLLQVSCRFERDWFVIRLALEAPLDELGLFLVEAMMVTVQRGIELIIGRRLRDARLQFAFAKPAHAGMYSRFLHGECRFEAANTAIRIPRALMEAMNPFHDPHAWQQALSLCESLAASLSADAASADSTSNGEPRAWHSRITQLLQQQPGQLWTLAEVAEHFHVSSRTLMRYLKFEGTNYQRVLDAELERQAKAHLRSPRHTVESVALALGYQDATAFRRAFRRWSGMSPSAWLADQS